MAYNHLLLGHSDIVLILTTSILWQANNGAPGSFCLHGQERMGYPLKGKRQLVIFGSRLPVWRDQSARVILLACFASHATICWFIASPVRSDLTFDPIERQNVPYSFILYLFSYQLTKTRLTTLIIIIVSTMLVTYLRHYLDIVHFQPRSNIRCQNSHQLILLGKKNRAAWLIMWKSPYPFCFSIARYVLFQTRLVAKTYSSRVLCCTRNVWGFLTILLHSC